jgi:ribosomal protein L11 methyltransferase
MEKYGRNKSAVLDVGSGTGVLSLCAAKLSAENVIAIDNNEWCFLNGKENVVRNNVEDLIAVRFCEIVEVEERNFDLILANINKHILINIKNELAKRLANGGTLILSGVLIIDKDDVVNKYISSGLKFVEAVQEDEWCGLVFEK